MLLHRLFISIRLTITVQ